MVTALATGRSHPPPGEVRAADLFGAVSLAADLARGVPLEHVLRSCYMGMPLAEELGLPASQRVELYYAELLMDVGCTAWTSQLAAFLVGDEILARQRFVFFVDPANPVAVLGWLRQHLALGASTPRRARHAFEFLVHGRAFVRAGFRNTCEVAQRFAQRMGRP